MGNLEEMGKFLEIYHLSRLSQDEIENKPNMADTKALYQQSFQMSKV